MSLPSALLKNNEKEIGRIKIEFHEISFMENFVQLITYFVTM